MLGDEVCFESLFDLIDEYEAQGNEVKGRAFSAIAYKLQDENSAPRPNLASSDPAVAKLHQQRLAIAEKIKDVTRSSFLAFAKQKTRTCKSCKNAAPLTLSIFMPLHREDKSIGFIACPSCHSKAGLLSQTQENKIDALEEKYRKTQARYVATYRKVCEKLYKKKRIEKHLVIGQWVHEEDYDEYDDYE